MAYPKAWLPMTDAEVGEILCNPRKQGCLSKGARHWIFTRGSHTRLVTDEQAEILLRKPNPSWPPFQL